MSIMTLPPQLTPPGVIEKKLITAQRLGRLHDICKTVGPDKMTGLMRRLGGLDAFTPDILRTALAKEGIPIDRLYHELIEQDGLKCAKRIFKDLTCILMGPPYRRSVHGVNCGVLFVDYKTTHFVLKWLTPSERGSQAMYARCLNLLKDPQLRMPDSRHLCSATDPLATCLPVEEPIADGELGLSAFTKVPGAALLDFIPARYLGLPFSQRIELIRGLGKVAMLDTVLSNQDRLQRPVGTSNLGNLMADYRENRLVLFLIDNETELSSGKVREIKTMVAGVFPVAEVTNQICRALLRKTSKMGEHEKIIGEQFCDDLRRNSEALTGGFQSVLTGLQKSLSVDEMVEFERIKNRAGDSVKLFTELLPNLQACLPA
jgi:hypothetical protein